MRIHVRRDPHLGICGQVDAQRPHEKIFVFRQPVVNAVPDELILKARRVSQCLWGCPEAFELESVNRVELEILAKRWEGSDGSTRAFQITPVLLQLVRMLQDTTMSISSRTANLKGLSFLDNLATAGAPYCNEAGK